MFGEVPPRIHLGSPDWFDVVYQKATGLFGETVDKAADSNIALTRWYRKRLKGLFGFSSSARLVRSSSNHPLYYLIHAGHTCTADCNLGFCFFRLAVAIAAHHFG